MRRSGGRVRVVAQLIDAETGNHIWAERYDRASGRRFRGAGRDHRAAVTAILPAVADAELRRALRKPPESLGAWEAYQRGLWHIGKANAADNEQAKQFLQHAIALDANFRSGVRCHGVDLPVEGAVFATLPLQEAAVTCAEVGHEKAVEMDPNDADAHAMLAWPQCMEGINDERSRQYVAGRCPQPELVMGQCRNGVHPGSSPASPRRLGEALLTALRLDPRDPLNAFSSPDRACRIISSAITSMRWRQRAVPSRSSPECRWHIGCSRPHSANSVARKKHTRLCKRPSRSHPRRSNSTSAAARPGSAERP